MDYVTDALPPHHSANCGSVSEPARLSLRRKLDYHGPSIALPALFPPDVFLQSV